MNKFSIVLTLLLCGSCALALDPNLEKTKSATGIGSAYCQMEFT
ncbi:hypothetical protein ACOM5D_000717 [Campylobacter jejuni]